MTAPLDRPPASAAAAIAWPTEPLDPPLLATGGAARWLGPAISLGIFAAVLFQLRHLHMIDVVRMVPRAPGFWLLFAAYYLATPATDYLIFNRLWGLPPAAGFGALTRKFVGNEILLGYIGELHFYSWARARLRMVAAPFGAVKDVAILSALVGNGVTLAMLLVAYPYLGALHLGLAPRTLTLSVAVMLGTSAAMLLLRQRLFTLPPAELGFVALAQLGRVVVTTLLPAALWHLALPQVAMGWWLLLAAVRVLVSRLPLLPNKDIVFAGIAAWLVGHNIGITDLMTMMASLLLATHIAVGAGLVIAEFATRQEPEAA